MTNPCKIDARKCNAKNMENDANMAPKLKSKYIKKHEKTIQKHIKKNDAKIKRQKAMRLEGPWARSAGRGKEFLWRLQVKVPSCIQHPAKNKHPANN